MNKNGIKWLVLSLCACLGIGACGDSKKETKEPAEVKVSSKTQDTPATDSKTEDKAIFKVTVKDIQSTDGTLYFVLWKEKEGFPINMDYAYRVEALENITPNSTYSFEQLPFGEYAVTVYQDVNDNGELDKNFMGFPDEPVAMSNMESLGPPSFDLSLIKIDNAEKEISLKFLNE